MTNRYIIFDGNCGFCNKTAFFIAKRDFNNHYIYVSNQSVLGEFLLNDFDIVDITSKTIILFDSNKVYIKSTAIRNIFLNLPRFRILGYLMLLFPKTLSYAMYDLMSKIRKRIVKANHCQIPNDNIRNKFVL